MFNIYAKNYAPIDPLVPPCDINVIPIGYVGENRARCLVFDLTECVQTFGDGGFQISFIRPDDLQPYIVLHTDRLDNEAIWEIDSSDTAQAGNGLVQLLYSVDDVICKSALYRTVVFESNGENGDAPDPYEGLLDQIAAYASQSQAAAAQATAAAQEATTAVANGIATERSQRIAADTAIDERLDALQAAVGGPLTAATAAAMTDTSKVYVYTGTEEGYTFGNWYYYDGANWVSGGVYNATGLQTDKTLSISGMAADAKVTGDLLNAALITETATAGAIVSFDDGADGAPLKSLAINITAQQSGSGDPSPSNIREITAFDATNITVASENLLFGCETRTVNGVTATVNADGSWTLNGTCTASEFIVLKSGIYLKAGRYTLKCIKTNDPVGDVGSGTRCQIYSNSKSTGLNVRWSNATDYTSSANLPEANDYHLRIRIAANVSYDNITMYPMLVLGDTAPSEFITAKRTTYNISFGSAGTVYGGTLDVTSGMLTLTHKSVDMGNLTWTYYTTGTNPVFRSGGISDRRFGTDADGINPICSMYSFYRNATLSTLAQSMPDKQFGFQSTIWWIVVRDTDYTDVDNFKAAVTGQTICYELETPVSYQLDPTTIKSILGQNNIWADCGDITELTYRADTKLYIDKQIGG